MVGNIGVRSRVVRKLKPLKKEGVLTCVKDHVLPRKIQSLGVRTSGSLVYVSNFGFLTVNLLHFELLPLCLLIFEEDLKNHLTNSAELLDWILAQNLVRFDTRTALGGPRLAWGPMHLHTLPGKRRLC